MVRLLPRSGPIPANGSAVCNRALEVALIDVAKITPLIAVISALPISVNGLGVAEAAFVFLYSHAGLTPSQALAAAVGRRLLILALALLGGIVSPFVWTGRPIA